VLVAGAAQTEHSRPLSLFTRFHRVVPARRSVGLRIEPERRGRGTDVLRAELADDDRLLASFSMTFARDAVGPLEHQAVPPLRPLVQPRPVWAFLEDLGIEPPRIMRRIGFHGEAADVPVHDDGWHLGSHWPGTTSEALAVRSAVAVMAIDWCVAPATIRANGLPLNEPWPVSMPSLDLTAWFYAPEAAPPGGWLLTRTAVPVRHAGFSVGRTQVFAGTTLIAEGMSQAMLVRVATR
jgi:acyl-CoA thioesterase